MPKRRRVRRLPADFTSSCMACCFYMSMQEAWHKVVPAATSTLQSLLRVGQGAHVRRRAVAGRRWAHRQTWRGRAPPAPACDRLQRSQALSDPNQNPNTNPALHVDTLKTAPPCTLQSSLRASLEELLDLCGGYLHGLRRHQRAAHEVGRIVASVEAPDHLVRLLAPRLREHAPGACHSLRWAAPGGMITQCLKPRAQHSPSGQQTPCVRPCIAVLLHVLGSLRGHRSRQQGGWVRAWEASCGSQPLTVPKQAGAPWARGAACRGCRWRSG